MIAKCNHVVCYGLSNIGPSRIHIRANDRRIQSGRPKITNRTAKLIEITHKNLDETHIEANTKPHGELDLQTVQMPIRLNMRSHNMSCSLPTPTTCYSTAHTQQMSLHQYVAPFLQNNTVSITQDTIQIKRDIIQLNPQQKA